MAQKLPRSIRERLEGVLWEIFRNRVLIAVALGHFAVDALANLVPVLVAFLSFPLGLTIAQVGLAGTIYAITGSLSQPYFGHLADQGKGRTLAIIGLFWIVLWLSVAAFVPSYGLLALCLGMAGIGSGAFHPQGAMNAFLHSGGRGGGLSIWYVGGAIGYALSPAVAGLVIQRVGQIGILFLSLAMLPAAIVLAKYLPGATAAKAKTVARVRGTGLVQGLFAGALGTGALGAGRISAAGDLPLLGCRRPEHLCAQALCRLWLLARAIWLGALSHPLCRCRRRISGRLYRRPRGTEESDHPEPDERRARPAALFPYYRAPGTLSLACWAAFF